MSPLPMAPTNCRSSLAKEIVADVSEQHWVVGIGYVATLTDFFYVAAILDAWSGNSEDYSPVSLGLLAQ